MCILLTPKKKPLALFFHANQMHAQWQDKVQKLENATLRDYFASCINNQSSALETILQQDATLLHSAMENNLQGVHICALFGATDCLHVLLKNGAHANATSAFVPSCQEKMRTFTKRFQRLALFTPLLYTIYYDHVECFNLLIQHFVVEPMFMHPMNMSILCDRRVMLAKCKTLTFKDDVTPLMMCAFCSSDTLLPDILGACSNILSVHLATGNTALHFAAEQNNATFVNEILEKRADEVAINIGMTNLQGLSPIQILVKANNTALACKLSTFQMQTKLLHGEMIKAGMLTKEGHVIHNLRERHFMLFPKELKYYQVSDSTEPTERGSIPLTPSTTLVPSDRYPHSFAISVQGKTWYVIAKNEAERQDWTDAISLAIKQL